MPSFAAIVVDRFGGPEVLTPADVEAWPPGPGKVTIAVELASVTFVETQLRAGRPPNPAMLPRLPWIPGNGVAGTVSALGEGAPEQLLGAWVVSTTGGAGGYASQAEADAAALIPVPEGLPLESAAALLADGRTATMLADAAATRPGERVLVEAAAGGVGSLLVQLAAAAGAEVVAAAGGKRKLEVARELGASEAVDYSRPGWAEGLEPVDVVFDGVGGEIGATARARLRLGGRYLPFGAAGGAMGRAEPSDAAEPGDTAERGDAAGARGDAVEPGEAAGAPCDGGGAPDDAAAGADDAATASGQGAAGIEVVSPAAPSPAQQRDLVERAFALAQAGTLRPLIGQRFALRKAAAAHRAIEARETIGKTLLVP